MIIRNLSAIVYNFTRLDYEVYIMHRSVQKLMITGLMLCPPVCLAQWEVLVHNNIDNGSQTRIASIENTDGYELEVYRDENNAVRLRFNASKTQARFESSHCPTYQVDEQKPQNVSVNDARCLSNGKWAEYVLGYVIDDQIESDLLHTIKNGIVIHYRFIAQEGVYKETEFTLAGSSRALSEALSNPSL